jgi:hypothetical protein
MSGSVEREADALISPPSALLGALVHAVLIVLDLKRRGWRTSFWLFRLVSRPGGRYLVTK